MKPTPRLLNALQGHTTGRHRATLLFPVLLAIGAVIAGLLAYVVPVDDTIRVGWLGDQVFLPRGEGQRADDIAAGRWYGDEPTEGSMYGRSRWTRPQAQIAFPGLGAGQPVTVTIHAKGWPADTLNTATRQPDLIASTGDATVGRATLTPDWQTYSFTFTPESANPTLLLRTSDVLTGTQTYPTDRRPKGMRVDLLTVSAGGPMRPAALPVLALVALSLGGYGTARRWWHTAAATAVGALLLLGGALALATARLWAAPLLPWVAIAALLIFAIAHVRTLAQVGRTVLARYATADILGVSVACVIVLVGLVATQALIRRAGALYGLAATLTVLAALVIGRRWWALLADATDELLRSRWAWALLAGFLAGWFAFLWAVIRQMPYVGHADYADNAVVARNLLAGRGWVVDYVTQFYHLNPGGSVTRPQETWPILQPVWMALSFAMFGVADWSAKVPNLIFLLLLGVGIFTVGGRLWDRRVGMVAAVLLLVNYLFFRFAIYTTTDLAFVVFSFAAIWLIWRMGAAPRPGIALVLAAGLLTGLMMFQKPSGALIAFGMGLWLLWARWNDAAGSRWQRVRAAVQPAAIWTLTALVVLSPYLIRNYAVFGKLFYSTESYDAWVLSYTDWEDIYKVYTPEQGLSETDGLPERSWVLRWGFDRTLHKLATQVIAVRNYLLPPWNDQARPLTDPLGQLKPLLFAVGAWLSLAGMVQTLHRRPRLIGLLLLAFGPFTIFLITYWHADEERYFVMVMPWLALLAAAALWGLYDVAARFGRGRWAFPALMIVTAAVVTAIQPSQMDITNKITREPGLYAQDIEAYEWLRANTPTDTVVMTRLPWQANWHSERPALMIPNTASADTMRTIAQYYNARFLMRDVLNNPSPQAIAVINELIDDGTLKLVHTTSGQQAFDAGGRTVTLQTRIYQFTTEGDR